MRINTGKKEFIEFENDKDIVRRTKTSPYKLTNEAFDNLVKEMKDVKDELGKDAVVTLGEGKDASTFVFTSDKDQNDQKILFVDGYFVVRVSLDTKANKINVYTTSGTSPYKSFDANGLITKKMEEFAAAEDEVKMVKKAKEEVVRYFETMRVEEPILEHAKNEVDKRDSRIKELENEISEIEQQMKDKKAEIDSFISAEDKTRKSKESKQASKEYDDLSAKKASKEKEKETLEKQLNEVLDPKLAKKLEEKLNKYKKEIADLKEMEEKNNNDIDLINNKITLLKDREDQRRKGIKVESDATLKTGYEYRKEIKVLEAANEDIEGQISKLNKKIADVEKQQNNNLGYIAQKEAAEKVYEENKEAVAPKNDLAIKTIKKIDKEEYPEAKKTPEGVEEDTVVAQTARIGNAKYEAATKCLEKEISKAVIDLAASKSYLRNSENLIENFFGRALDITNNDDNLKYYNRLNGYTPYYWGENVTLGIEPGYGCLVVGTKLNDGKTVNGKDKYEHKRTMYLIVGKTYEEVQNAYPQTAEDFLNIEGAKVYAGKLIRTNKSRTKANFEGYENTSLAVDKKTGEYITDSTGNRIFDVSGTIKIPFDIWTEKRIADYEEEQKAKAAKGERTEEKVVDFTTPVTMEKFKETLGTKECLDVEEKAYWREDRVKATVKKVVGVGCAILGVGAFGVLTAWGVNSVLDANNNAAAAYAVADEATKALDKNAAIESGKKQVGDKSIDYTYDKDKNVIMTKTNSTELTKDITPYNGQANAKGWTDAGAIYQYVYNTTINLGKDGNILTMDGNSLFGVYFKDFEWQTYEDKGSWTDVGAPRDGDKNVITDLLITYAKLGYDAGASKSQENNPKTAGTSAVDPNNEELNDAAQKRINKDTKGTNKAMVVDGVYVDFDKDTAFAVSENGKNIVKLTYDEDIQNLEQAISGMTETTTDWYTCAAANPYLPGVKYQNYYISDNTNINGDVYSKNFIEVEKEDADYTFTEFKGYDVLNEETNKMPSMNKVSYVSLVGTAAHNIDGYTVYGKKGDETVYTATTPESTTAATAGQIFNYEKTK